MTRISYPFEIGGQITEPVMQAYIEKWAFTNELSTEVTTPDKLNTIGQKVAAFFILYHKPSGVKEESNIGKGPRCYKLTSMVNLLF